ncbi:hypothetical protein [Flavobacterium sp.]|uniref:hypothetical protein n=1 Tax=Flavobacterium sp. TaxID=239 RepID=UPI002623A1D8|nr:hypothetical protein [Flavobacterium sp.]
MKNFLKIVLILFLIASSMSYAQNKEVETLIQKLDNKDAYIVLTKTTSPRLKGTTASRIIEIGKIAAPELIAILDSQSQGIAAHFILSKIWEDDWTEEACCSIRNIGAIEIVTINGLEIRIEKDELYATPESLKKKKEVWKKICQV